MLIDLREPGFTITPAMVEAARDRRKGDRRTAVRQGGRRATDRQQATPAELDRLARTLREERNV